jgi:anthranilate synthase/aminodeoxychorismate synthase-like glutamine amidotransferase
MILLIDNYDSFVYNLKHYLIELGETVQVVRNDAITIDEIKALNPTTIIISPGPCTPNEAGISNAIIEQLSGQIPILGVCLGHQCIGAVFGGQVVKAPKPMHGKTGVVCYDEQLQPGKVGMFDGLPQNFTVMRYHSLIIEEATLPPCLIKTAWLGDEKLIMGVRHKEHPTFGVQFHPESVATEYGHQMLKNFLMAGGREH